MKDFNEIKEHTKKDVEKLLDDLEDLLISKKDKKAAIELGKIYFNGVIVTKNILLAKTYFEMGVEDNLAASLYYLGLITYEGYNDIKPNYELAYDYFIRTVKTHEPCDSILDAEYMLANMYYEGIGTTKDKELALKLLKRQFRYQNIKNSFDFNNKLVDVITKLVIYTSYKNPEFYNPCENYEYIVFAKKILKDKGVTNEEISEIEKHTKEDLKGTDIIKKSSLDIPSSTELITYKNFFDKSGILVEPVAFDLPNNGKKNVLITLRTNGEYIRIPEIGYVGRASFIFLLFEDTKIISGEDYNALIGMFQIRINKQSFSIFHDFQKLAGLKQDNNGKTYIAGIIESGKDGAFLYRKDFDLRDYYDDSAMAELKC